MINLGKYRILGIATVIIFIIAVLLTFAAIWNTMLSTQVKHEGWVLLFLSVSFLCGLALFILSYKSSDSRMVDIAIAFAVKKEREMIVSEKEKKNAETVKENITEEELNKALKTILNGISDIKNKSEFCNALLTKIAKQVGVVQGLIYLKEVKTNFYKVTGEYALTGKKPEGFEKGDTLPGQAVINKTSIHVENIPENYFTVLSGLGESKPKHLLFLPVNYKKDCIALCELAFFSKPDSFHEEILNKLAVEVAERLNKFVAPTEK